MESVTRKTNRDVPSLGRRTDADARGAVRVRSHAERLGGHKERGAARRAIDDARCAGAGAAYLEPLARERRGIVVGRTD